MNLKRLSWNGVLARFVSDFKVFILFRRPKGSVDKITTLKLWDSKYCRFPWQGTTLPQIGRMLVFFKLCKRAEVEHFESLDFHFHRRCGMLDVTAVQLHSGMHEFTFCSDPNPTGGMSKLCGGENLRHGNVLSWK